jgi:hypothetical protein
MIFFCLKNNLCIQFAALGVLSGAAKPLDFIARLAALVPEPRVNVKRVCAQQRVTGTGGTRQAGGGQRASTPDREEPTPAGCRAATTWAQRVKRVFGIGIESCLARGGAVRMIACIGGGQP